MLAVVALAGTARAQLTEPPDSVNTSGFGPIPKDPRTLCPKSSTVVGGTIGCTGSAFTGDYWSEDSHNTLDNMSLIGLFNWYESDDTTGKVLVDYQKDAKTEPSTFNPLCSLQGTLVMRGGSCAVDFGWYCADGTPNPTIHPLVSIADVLAYSTAKNPPYPISWQNNDNGFLPKTGYKINGSTTLDKLAAGSDFAACSTKKVGFAVKGNTSSACSQSKYTERNLNESPTGSTEHYIAATIYTSKKVPGRFYIGMEDLPTSPARFDAPYVHKTTSGDVTWNADGDFNDFVYMVEGVVCQGGGQLCTVPGKQGICATGVTSCVTDANQTPSCDPVFTPHPETCNAIDDDCNGSIDDGDNLCPAGYTCYKGTCVGGCASGETSFACPAGQVCVGAAPGYCIDASCANANCNVDQKCVNGQCVGGCDGVTCNAGEQCVAGKCVDLCDARQQAGLAACPDNFVCQNGACVPNCTCLNCPDPTTQECQADSTKPGFGRCVASGCADGHCGDQLCLPGGTCVADPCANNTCGANQICTAAKQYDSTQPNDHQYSCSNPSDPTANGGSGTGGGTSVCLQNCGTAGSGNGTAGNAPSAGSPSNPGLVTNGTSTGQGASCACRITPNRAPAWGLVGLAGLALLGVRRRRRVAHCTGKL